MINEQGTTIILTTHYLEEAESLCRNIAIIDGGRIIENDRMAGVHPQALHGDLRAQLPQRDRRRCRRFPAMSRGWSTTTRSKSRSRRSRA